LYLTAGSADSLAYDAFVHILFSPSNKFDRDYFNGLRAKWESTIGVPLNDVLKDKHYLLGEKISLPDICLGFSLLASGRMGWNDKFPNLVTYIARLSKRPAFLKVFPEPLEQISPPEPPKKLKIIEQEAKVQADATVPLPVVNSEGIPKLTIYHIPFTRSTRVLWLIREIGGELQDNVKVEKITWEFIKTKEYFAINPNRLVPAATFDDKHMFEAGGIMKYICEQLCPHYPVMKILFPPTWTRENWQRHHLYSYWTIVHLDKEIISNFFGLSRFRGKLSGKMEKWFQKVVGPKLLSDLGDNEYINGPTFTCTDIYVGYTLLLAFNLSLFAKTGKIGSYFARLSSREALSGLLAEK